MKYVFAPHNSKVPLYAFDEQNSNKPRKLDLLSAVTYPSQLENNYQIWDVFFASDNKVTGFQYKLPYDCASNGNPVASTLVQAAKVKAMSYGHGTISLSNQPISGQEKDVCFAEQLLFMKPGSVLDGIELVSARGTLNGLRPHLQNWKICFKLYDEVKYMIYHRPHPCSPSEASVLGPVPAVASLTSCYKFLTSPIFETKA